MIDYTIQLFRDLFFNIDRTIHRTSCASECCHNSCECMHEGEPSSEIMSAASRHEQEQESNIVFTSRLEVRRLSQS